MRRALVIVGKAPRPGASKTRLVPPLSSEEAAELSQAFLLDTVATGLSLGWECVCVVHPLEDGAALRALLPSRVRCLVQAGHGLGDAIRGAFDGCFGEGYERVLLVDSDSPTLPARILDQASNLLRTHDVTVGPSVDGGYYMLGLREPHPELFNGIEWSTPRVLAQTLDRAGCLRVAVLETWYDVDTPDDLARLQAELQEQPTPASNTTQVLQRLTLRVTG